MPISDDAKWHWAEGNKFAVEGLKTLLLLNGGTAAALLAFVGTTEKPPPIGNALAWLAVGASFAVVAFVFAYLTQLHYGNEANVGQYQRKATWPHNVAYGCIAGSVLSFWGGLYYAWQALKLLR